MSRRILLADDSVTIQKVIELTFMDDDYEVRAVGNGDEALAMLTALTVDFVIADVHMPGASGYEVCRRSKQLRPEVPVLLLVGTFEPFDEAQARESGADSYLKKPFDSQELLGRVHELLAPAAAAAAPTAGTAGTAGAPQPADVIAAPAAAAAAATASAAPAPPAPSAPSVPSAPSATASASTAPEPAAAPPADVAPAAAGAGAAQGVRLTGGVEAAASWQEFELETEPELVADPWSEVPSPPAAATAPPAARPFEQPFSLGDLDEPPAAAKPAANASTPDWLPAAPAVAAAERFDRPFTLGEPLDDRVLLDQAEVQEEEPAAAPAVPATPAATGTPAAPKTPAVLETPAIAATSAAPASTERAAAAGNGQATSQPIADIAGAAGLGDQDVDRIARRVVELIGDKVVRDIAWEVIPDLAEVVIKDRLRELESQIE